ncbi:5'-nucleotidase C-terminal domain-containing protein [Streptomyces sp. NPDC006197]|uniref:5'-nucleotidase C-terminal domain-containing protein n=1 Tax=Streptomyces sp. NPDC006197 TaxID=3156685 RepID=UPI0033A18056
MGAAGDRRAARHRASAAVHRRERGQPALLRLSEELSHSVDMSRTGADRLLAETVRVDGQPVAPNTTYRVVLNEFLANDGNGFTVFGGITAREGGEMTDLEALVAHLETTTSATAPAAPPAPGRITFVAR